MSIPRLLTVNELLLDEITKINNTLVPLGFHTSADFVDSLLVQESMGALVDSLGVQSATEQGLSKVITSAERIKTTPDCTLYLLKDSAANYGNGEVIGMLKMGLKHLFLFDERDQCRELEPLCVLDFYVRHEYQRHGHGRRLFDYMLRDTGAMPTQLAVDGPSPKIEQFLIKHYGLESLIRQSNNFAVAPQFFAANDQQGELPPNADVMRCVGRHAAPKPNSSIAEVIHGSHRTQHFSADWAENRERAVAAVKRARSPAPAHAENVNGEHESRAPEQSGTPRPAELPIPAVDDSGALLQTPGAAGQRSPRADAITPTHSPHLGAHENGRRESQLTNQGYFDVKFYHNKLW